MDLTVNVTLCHCQAGYHVSFMAFMKVGFPFMLQSVTICCGWLLLLNSAGVWVNCDLPGRETLQECMDERAAVLSTGAAMHG